MKRFLVLLLLAVAVSFGCQQRVVTQPESKESREAREAEALRQQKEKQMREEAARAKTSPEKITERETTPAETAESREKAAAVREGMFQDVLFDFDKYSINDQYKPGLKSAASWMLKHSEAKLSVEGHCDERGTNEYNLALGDRRAKAVKDYLVSLGVSSAKIDSVSFGEEKPLCAEHTEECWTKNRRAHLVVIGGAAK